MHKKDMVKEVIQKYIDKGVDFFELTPSYLQDLEELKGFSERTLKRGRTEYKIENNDQLKGKSKAKLNTRKKLITFLEENPDTGLDRLKKKFSSLEKKEITDIYQNWADKNGAALSGQNRRKDAEESQAGSLRQKVFNHLDNHPDLTLSKLEKVFQEENKKTISNYLDQWRKERSTKGKKISTKKRIHDYLDVHPTAALKDLKAAFPDINPSSIGAYHSLWKSQKKNGAPQKRGRKPKSEINIAKTIDQKSMTVESAKQIIDALNHTVEAQKKAIDALKAQNAMLEEIKAYSFPELRGMSKKEIEKFERVMATFLKGLRKS